MALCDVLVGAAACVATLAITVWPHRDPTLNDVWRVAGCSVVPLLALYLFGCYRTVVHFLGSHSISRIFAAYAFATVLVALLRYALPGKHVGWNTLIVFGLVGALGATSCRLLAFMLLRLGRHDGSTARVMIYGAGQAGAQLASALQISGRYRVVAFVDDRLALHGRTVLDLPVYGPSQLNTLKDRNAFDEILLAIPSAPRSRRRQILESLESLAVKVMVVPGVDEIATGTKQVDELREVQIEDLLGRDPVAPIPDLIEACIRQQSVLVTGAGGSIGSELCRQIATRGVARLVLLEVSEFALYEIEKELRPLADATGFELIPILASVGDAKSLERALHRHQVKTVYHAAAYKHVPLVEGNIQVAVNNNVFGTLNVVRAAIACHARNFVLISTDKAVRPTSVMGATKRVCELIVQAYAAVNPDIRFSMVRFGNVLASSGSVVPLFKQQIRQGGPITVTHPDVTRYFMTIPEAAQLVLQAGAMGQQGEVFLLDMGRAVKIQDLAERMVHLSGFEVRTDENPRGDIEIRITGLRPGEKLYEELLIGDNPRPTAHPRIFLAQEKSISLAHLERVLVALEAALTGDQEKTIRQLLSDVVDGFGRPAGSVPRRPQTLGLATSNPPPFVTPKPASAGSGVLLLGS